MTDDNNLVELGRQLAMSGKHAPKSESGVVDVEIVDLCGETATPASGENSDQPPEATPAEPIDGAELLDDIAAWFGRFIVVTDLDDLNILALWTVHTHLVWELYSTPRLLIDSIMEGSGKTTVIDHLCHLCVRPVQAAAITSSALIPRLLESGMRTILVDEAQRSLRPDKPNVEDLLSVINTGYRRGGTRPVLVPVKGGGWEAEEMSTFAPVAMAGISPNLPADTVSRQIRVLLMPDLDGAAEDSDWELIEDDAGDLRIRIAAWALQVHDEIKDADAALPSGLIGRAKEKWKPLARVAAVAGGEWPLIAFNLIRADMALEEAMREDGLKTIPPGLVAMRDLHAVWDDRNFIPTYQLVQMLLQHNPGYWGAASSPFSKDLNEHRLGRLISQAAKVNSSRPDTHGPRGYLRRNLEPTWIRLGIAPKQTGSTGYPGSTGSNQPPVSGLSGTSGLSGLDGTPAEPGAESRCSVCDGELFHPQSVQRGVCEKCRLAAERETQQTSERQSS